MHLKFVAIPIFMLAAQQSFAQGSACIDGAPEFGTKGKDCPLVGGMEDVVTQNRCWNSDKGEFNPNSDKVDWLNSNTKAETRFRWAIACNYVPYYYETMFKNAKNPITGALIPRQRYKYPTFAYPAVMDGYPIWKPEVSAPEFPTAPASCRKPAEVIWLTTCDAGCYERSMRLLFADGYKSLPDVMQDRSVKHLMTVKEGSTFDNIAYQLTEIDYFTRDLNVIEQTIVKLEMASGGVLKVTENHPLLTADGTIQQADMLKVGDQLVKASGEADSIIKLETFVLKDRVYNIAPKSLDPVQNLVVAEGYINGSQRYQDETLQDLNRLVIRHNIPDDLIN